MVLTKTLNYAGNCNSFVEAFFIVIIIIMDGNNVNHSSLHTGVLIAMAVIKMRNCARNPTPLVILQAPLL
jgi:ABC-type bacteriocin/lantibiotic exporter with double-glycine peptidase domain